MKKFCWFEGAFTFIFCFCSARNRFLPVVTAKSFVDSSFNIFETKTFSRLSKNHCKTFEAVFVRGCYVLCFSNFNLDCVLLQVVAGTLDFLAFSDQDLFVFLIIFSMKNPKAIFVRKCFDTFHIEY